MQELYSVFLGIIKCSENLFLIPHGWICRLPATTCEGSTVLEDPILKLLWVAACYNFLFSFGFLL